MALRGPSKWVQTHLNLNGAFGLDLIILADASNKTNRGTITTRLAINSRFLVQIYPNEGKPKFFMQKQELRLFSK